MTSELKFYESMKSKTVQPRPLPEIISERQVIIILIVFNNLIIQIIILRPASPFLALKRFKDATNCDVHPVCTSGMV